jgi:hypothetical protein
LLSIVSTFALLSFSHTVLGIWIRRQLQNAVLAALEASVSLPRNGSDAIASRGHLAIEGQTVPSLKLQGVEPLSDPSDSQSYSARHRAASLLTICSADLVFVLTLEMRVRCGSREDGRLGTLAGDLVFQSEDLAGDLERAFHHGALGGPIVAQAIRRCDGLGPTRQEIAQAVLSMREGLAVPLAPRLGEGFAIQMPPLEPCVSLLRDFTCDGGNQTGRDLLGFPKVGSEPAHVLSPGGEIGMGVV